MEIYKDLSSPASKEFEKLLNTQFTKIKNLKEFFIYKNPSNGKKEIGAKTKNGDIHEFQIRGLMMTNEFQELKKYVLNEL
jgi:hypothetical protein